MRARKVLMMMGEYMVFLERFERDSEMGLRFGFDGLMDVLSLLLAVGSCCWKMLLEDAIVIV